MLKGETVRDSMLLLVHEAPRRYSEFVRELGRPDKTIFENLRSLQQTGLVAKTVDRYTITKAGEKELRRQSLRRLVDIWVELGVEDILPIEETWNECLWETWIDPLQPHYEGPFPEDCDVIEDFGDKWKHRLAFWRRRLWMFSFDSITDEGCETWIADRFRDSVSERTAQLCVEVDVVLSTAA
jgi:DNA-binding HxlR family transcriptional regulator